MELSYCECNNTCNWLSLVDVKVMILGGVYSCCEGNDKVLSLATVKVMIMGGVRYSEGNDNGRSLMGGA